MKISSDLASRIRCGLVPDDEMAAIPTLEVVSVLSDPSGTLYTFGSREILSSAIDKDRRTVSGVVHSTEGVNRNGFVVLQSGWSLDSYKKNPVILLNHDSDVLPIAEARKVRRGKTKEDTRALLIDEQYLEDGAGDAADRVWRHVAAGRMRGRSVGFLPIKVRVPEDPEREQLGLPSWGVVIEESELLESSVATIPADPKALAGASYRGMMTFALRAEIIDGATRGLITQRDAAEFLASVPGTDEYAARRASRVSMAPRFHRERSAQGLSACEQVAGSPRLEESVRMLSETVMTQADEIARLNEVIEDGRIDRTSHAGQGKNGGRDRSPGGVGREDIESVFDAVCARLETQRLQRERSQRLRAALLKGRAGA